VALRLHTDLNVTTLFVTHDQEEAMEVSNRIAIFSRGNLEQIGTPREVYEEPANEFVARFIGVFECARTDGHRRPRPLRRDGVSRAGPAGRLHHAHRLPPYAVKISSLPTQFRYRAVLNHTFFPRRPAAPGTGAAFRPYVAARMTKEGYAHLGLKDGKEVSLQIRSYRILRGENEPLTPEISTTPRPDRQLSAREFEGSCRVQIFCPVRICVHLRRQYAVERRRSGPTDSTIQLI